MRRLFVLFVIVSFAACTSPTTSPSTSPSSSSTPSPSATSPPPMPALAIPMLATRFGAMPEIPLLGDEPAYAGPATPRSLEGVAISASAEDLLTADAVAAIERQGFVVIPGDARLFHHVYGSLGYARGTVYVTADAMLHTWHLTFDKVLRSLEQDVLLPQLEDLATEMSDAASAQRATLEGTEWEAAAVRVDRLLQIETTLLGLASSEDRVVTEELARIEAHDEMTASEVFGDEFDYSRFTPRGHYTRNEDLTRFFRAMSVLGLAPLRIAGADEDDLRGAVLAARTLRGIRAPWAAIYEPTAFLVGAADDYTPFELLQVTEEVAPGARGPEDLDAADLVAIQRALLASREVQIDPEAASVRLMGVRFVLDSWILDRLVYPSVGTAEDPRLMPSTLDVASVFGSNHARRIQHETGQYDFEGYGRQASRLRDAVAARPAGAWGATVYDGWLWTLQPLWTPHGLAYPDLMRTPVWAAKDTMTGAASFAELKHDTILYAKQFGGEGANGEEPYPPRHWVEPEPVLYARLAATADLMRTGLEDRGLLTREADDVLTDLIDHLELFTTLATDELAHAPISDVDNGTLEEIGSWLESMWFRTADQTPDGASSTDEDAAIVADLGRGGDEVLEVATGRIDTLLILVPDDGDGFQLAHGAVYSFYEFTQPLGERLDDETWRAMLERGDEPDRPAWQEVLFP